VLSCLPLTLSFVSSERLGAGAGDGAALGAHLATCDEMAAAALDPHIRTDIVDLLYNPANVHALTRLMQLCGSPDVTVATSALTCIHNVLCPHTSTNLPLAATLLCVNRVRSPRPLR
jgi:hypothetical protein